MRIAGRTRVWTARRSGSGRKISSSPSLSGGCNVLTFLLDDPGKVMALDLNPYQNYLLEQMKIAAFRELSHPELLEFFGIRKSSRRRPVYGRLRAFLSADAARYWDSRPRRIDRGLIHAGRYESICGA